MRERVQWASCSHRRDELVSRSAAVGAARRRRALPPARTDSRVRLHKGVYACAAELCRGVPTDKCVGCWV